MLDENTKLERLGVLSDANVEDVYVFAYLNDDETLYSSMDELVYSWDTFEYGEKYTDGGGVFYAPSDGLYLATWKVIIEPTDSRHKWHLRYGDGYEYAMISVSGDTLTHIEYLNEGERFDVIWARYSSTIEFTMKGGKKNNHMKIMKLSHGEPPIAAAEDGDPK